MTVVKSIDVRAIFEKAAGRKLVDPKPPVSLDPVTIAGNLNTK